MEDNFYLGTVIHKNKILHKSTEKRVLYSEDKAHFIDLITYRTYPTDRISKEKEDYVAEDSLIPTDPNDYRDNFIYLLEKYKSLDHNSNKKRKKFLHH